MSTSLLGLGLCPCGTASYGYGSPATATAAVAPSNDTGRYVDPRSRDYVVDDDGNLERTDTATQLVMLALFTDRGSSAVSTLGLPRVPPVLTDRLLAQNEQQIRDTLAPLVRAGLIEIASVDVQRVGPSSIRRHVRYRDLLTGQESSIGY